MQMSWLYGNNRNMENEHALTLWRKSHKPKAVTQAALGKALGISRWYVNRLETGNRTPSFDLAMKIERVTGGEVNARDFAKREEVQK